MKTIPIGRIATAVQQGTKHAEHAPRAHATAPPPPAAAPVEPGLPVSDNASKVLPDRFEVIVIFPEPEELEDELDEPDELVSPPDELEEELDEPDELLSPPDELEDEFDEPEDVPPVGLQESGGLLSMVTVTGISFPLSSARVPSCVNSPKPPSQLAGTPTHTGTPPIITPP